MMDAAIKQRWVAALRAGTYQQGRHRLRTTDGQYCCLGVLCDLVSPESWEQGAGHHISRPAGDGLGHSTMLPGSIRMLAGLEESVTFTLINLNDAGQSFDRIADYIEGNL